MLCNAHTALLAGTSEHCFKLLHIPTSLPGKLGRCGPELLLVRLLVCAWACTSRARPAGARTTTRASCLAGAGAASWTSLTSTSSTTTGSIPRLITRTGELSWPLPPWASFGDGPASEHVRVAGGGWVLRSRPLELVAPVLTRLTPSPGHCLPPGTHVQCFSMLPQRSALGCTRAACLQRQAHKLCSATGHVPAAVSLVASSPPARSGWQAHWRRPR